MSRQKEPNLPFTFDDWDTIGVCVLQFYDVYFEEDFGPIKTGDKFAGVAVDYGEGFLEASIANEENENRVSETTVVHHVKFDFVPSEK